PSAIANFSLRSLTLDLLIWSSGEWRCESKVRWFISQLYGSGLSSRSNVTSAAHTGAVVASSAQASAMSVPAVVVLVIVLSIEIVHRSVSCDERRRETSA